MEGHERDRWLRKRVEIEFSGAVRGEPRGETTMDEFEMWHRGT